MRIDTDAIVQAILSAPGWARIGITAPKERLREEAAQELARAILSDRQVDSQSGDQFRLTL